MMRSNYCLIWTILGMLIVRFSLMVNYMWLEGDNMEVFKPVYCLLVSRLILKRKNGLIFLLWVCLDLKRVVFNSKNISIYLEDVQDIIQGHELSKHIQAEILNGESFPFNYTKEYKVQQSSKVNNQNQLLSLVEKPITENLIEFLSSILINLQF